LPDAARVRRRLAMADQEKLLFRHGGKLNI
jgi:hypothetical protein